MLRQHRPGKLSECGTIDSFNAHEQALQRFQMGQRLPQFGHDGLCPPARCKLESLFQAICLDFEKSAADPQAGQKTKEADDTKGAPPIIRTKTHLSEEFTIRLSAYRLD